MYIYMYIHIYIHNYIYIYIYISVPSSSTLPIAMLVICPSLPRA